ncbi:MAG: hypothetical protein V4574_00670 [Pseudomonadota bacterium]
MQIRFKLAAVAALFVASPAFAQTPPDLFDWDKAAGWSISATGLRHKSGLSCPSAAWKGLGPVAPMGHDTDPSQGVKTDATCQYYVYWDQYGPRPTRLVINIVKLPDVGAYVSAWTKAKNTYGVATERTVKRGAVTYRVLTWPDDPRHDFSIIVRDAPGTAGYVISMAKPRGYAETKYWPVIDALIKANP